MKDKIVIFGAGYYGRAVLRKCKEEKKFDCVCFFDTDKKKHIQSNFFSSLHFLKTARP